MSKMKGTIIETRGAYRYFDKEGNELHDGDTIMWADGRMEKLHATVQGLLGTDATNPSWIASGRAVECQYGVYPLGLSGVQEIVKVEPHKIKREAEDDEEDENENGYDEVHWH